MARPKGKLFALLAIFMAIGIVTATGAFTSVQAERDVEATVNNDTAALVGLTPYDGPNGFNATGETSDPQLSDGYADLESGVLRINLGGFQDGTPQGTSLNYNATTTFDFVFNISNNGRQDFNYYITRNGEAAGATNAVIFYQGQAGSGTNVTTSVNDGAAGALSPGSTHSISVEVDLTGVDNNDVSEGTSLLDSITIHANSV